jgi:hypothetical protein
LKGGGRTISKGGLHYLAKPFGIAGLIAAVRARLATQHTWIEAAVMIAPDQKSLAL